MKRVSVLSRRSRGAVVVFTAVSMVTLTGFAALAFDIGQLYVVKAELQNAADAAALAAAGSILGQEGLDFQAAYSAAVTYAGRNLTVKGRTGYPHMDVTFGRFDDPFNLSSPFVPVVDDTVNAVRVVLYRDQKHDNPVPLTFASVFGNHHADVSVVAVAGVTPAEAVKALPIALRAPGFGPVDPDVAEQNPGKVGPSYLEDDESLSYAGVWEDDDDGLVGGGYPYETGDQVIVFVDGFGVRPPVHLALDPSEYQGVAITDRLLSDRLLGREPPVNLSLGLQLPVWNQGTGNQNFGEMLRIRMRDGNPDNDTIVVPIVGILPDSRNDDGKLTGNVEIVDFAAVHLDGVRRVQVPDPTNPDRSLTIQLIVGTVVRLTTRGTGTATAPGYADSVFTLQLLR